MTATPVITTPAACRDCGATIPRERGKRPPERCPEHRAAQRSIAAGRARAAWIARNPDANRASKLAHDHANSAEYIAKATARGTNARRKAQMYGTQVDDARAVDVFERDGWICGICRTPVDPAIRYPDRMSPSLDHVVPLSRGGTHTWDNLQCSHLLCNIQKGDRLGVTVPLIEGGDDLGRYA